MSKPKTKEHAQNISKGRMGIKFTIQHKQNISKSLIGNTRQLGLKRTEQTKTKMKEFRKSISSKMREWNVEHPNKRFSNTSIERKVAEELTRRGIKFQQNVGVEKIKNVDFLLENKVIIECDGCYWHNCPEHGKNKHCIKVQADKHKDMLLQQHGYFIHRLWEHDINNSVEKCISNIIKKNKYK